MSIWTSVKKSVKQRVAKAKKIRAEDKETFYKEFRKAKKVMLKKKARQVAAMRYFPRRQVQASSPLQQIVYGKPVKMPKIKVKMKKRKKRR